MKLQSIPSVTPALYRVKEKKEKGDSGRGQKREEQSFSEEKKEGFSLKEQELEEAVRSFPKNMPFSAQIEKKAQELTVSLRDAHGTLIRELSAQEFLRLKARVQKGQMHGALLDARG